MDELVNLLLQEQRKIADSALTVPLSHDKYQYMCGYHGGIQHALNLIAEIRSGSEDHE